MWVARKGKWKLIGNPYDTSQRDYIFEEDRFLANLETDPGELTNQALQHPDIVKMLEKQYNDWLKKQSLDSMNL